MGKIHYTATTEFYFKMIDNKDSNLLLSHDSNNEDMDLQEKIEMKIQKAEELALKKGRFNRETFTIGHTVHIQDPSTKLHEEEGEVIGVYKYNG